MPGNRGIENCSGSGLPSSKRQTALPTVNAEGPNDNGKSRMRSTAERDSKSVAHVVALPPLLDKGLR